MKTKITIELEGKNEQELINALEAITVEIADGELGDDKVVFDGVTGKFSVDDIKDKEDYEEDAGYKLTHNQVKFLQDAEEQGLDISFDYSGRGMYDEKCPRVDVDDENEFVTKAKTRRDSMGLGLVIYCPR